MKPRDIEQRKAGAVVAYRDCAELCSRLASGDYTEDASPDMSARDLEVRNATLKTMAARLCAAFNYRADELASEVNPTMTPARSH